LIRAGVTGAAGYVGDPVGGSIVRPDILFPAYLAGLNLAEAFYLAMPRLNRRAVIIGDPLCAPFRHAVLARSDVEPPNDPVMQLPAAFAKRRLASLRDEYPHVPEGALMLWVRANDYDQHGDPATARRILEAVSAVAPNFASAQAHLAVLYDRSNDRDLAIERYRRALDAQPAYVRGEVVEISNSAGLMEVRPLALNNLAYDLAVYRHAPAEALPYAQKALAYRPNDPELLDTVAWVEHLLGDDKSAIGHLRTAVARAPANSTVWLHAGIVAAAVDAIPEAKRYLDMALQLNPSLETSDEVVALRTRFQAAGAPR
jgi:tetratricopeptide (TPR) repeat protein